jgi:hypothetical protein
VGKAGPSGLGCCQIRNLKTVNEYSRRLRSARTRTGDDEFLGHSALWTVNGSREMVLSGRGRSFYTEGEDKGGEVEFLYRDEDCLADGFAKGKGENDSRK